MTQIWWAALGGLFFSLFGFILIVLSSNVLVKIFEKTKTLESDLLSLTKDCLDAKREILEVKQRLPSRRRMDGLMDLMTPQSPYGP